MRRSQNVSAPIAAIVIAAALGLFFVIFNRPSQETAPAARPVPEPPPVEESQVADMFKGLSPLGVVAVMPQLVEDRMKGVRLAAIVRDSPAERAGLQAGDLVTAFEGNKLVAPEPLIFLLAQVQPKRTYQVEIVRSGKTMQLPVTGITPLSPEERVRF